MMTHKVYLMTH